MNNRQIRERYDKRAAIYDATMGRGESKLTGDFRARFGAMLRGQTLEIAIGSGLNLPYYSARVTRAFGVDLSRGMLDVAARRARDLHLPIGLAVMDAQQLA